MKKALYFTIGVLIVSIIYFFDPFALKTETKIKKEVKDYTLDMMTDPSSYQDYGFTEYQKNTDGSYEVYHDFLAANRMGGKAKETYRFVLDNNFKIVLAEKQ